MPPKKYITRASQNIAKSTAMQSVAKLPIRHSNEDDSSERNSDASFVGSISSNDSDDVSSEVYDSELEEELLQSDEELEDSIDESDIPTSTTISNQSNKKKLPISWFTNKSYANKSDVLAAVVQYHNNNQRDYKYVRNDSRRVYVKCVDEGCTFQLNFNFSQGNYSPPTQLVPHSCTAWTSSCTARASRSLHLSRMPRIKQWMFEQGRNATTNGLKSLLMTLGIKIEYKRLYRTVYRLKKEMFADDAIQYDYLESYIKVINNKNHHAVLEKDEFNRFVRLAIVYWQGIQQFTYYTERGIQLDGTFIKNGVGGILLVACFKDGNNNIRIVGIAIVAGENENNWTWFMQFLHDHLSKIPSFVISDREKGLINAVKTVFGNEMHHAYCFRHVMENFNARFKSKDLKGKAWKLAKATNTQQFEEAVAELNEEKPEAMVWLNNIGLEKITLFRSPVCRYLTVTSNNVESVNSRVASLRKLPITDMLLEIEKMVVTDRVKCNELMQSWDTPVCKYVSTLLNSAANYRSLMTCERTGTHHFLVIYNSRQPGRAPTAFRVNTTDKGTCSCGGPVSTGLPCAHLFHVLRTLEKEVSDFCCTTWLKSTYDSAYAPPEHDFELTQKCDLEIIEILPPALGKGRGRPRKKRIESQRATMEVDAQQSVAKKQYKCSRCNSVGHNSRKCPIIPTTLTQNDDLTQND
jgi:hypothetical protein